MRNKEFLESDVVVMALALYLLDKDNIKEYKNQELLKVFNELSEVENLDLFAIYLELHEKKPELLNLLTEVFTIAESGLMQASFTQLQVLMLSQVDIILKGKIKESESIDKKIEKLERMDLLDVEQVAYFNMLKKYRNTVSHEPYRNKADSVATVFLKNIKIFISLYKIANKIK